MKNKIKFIIFIIFSFIFLILFFQKTRKVVNIQADLDSTYAENRNLYKNSIIKNIKEFEKLPNKNQEEFIISYENSHWRDTVDCNFALKIFHDKSNGQWTYYSINYIIYENRLKNTKFNNELIYDREVYNHTYYKNPSLGILQNQIIISFLSDSLYGYRNRGIVTTASGFSVLGHLKWINDTLKYREYDLRNNSDGESKRLKKILNLIKEETSK